MWKRTEKGFVYHQLCQALIMYKPLAELSYAYQNPAAVQIAHHTANTWQKGRPYAEILDNTVQGKIVEEMFGDYIASNNQDLCYIPYDDFRSDSFCKHAPMDGLLCRKDNPHLSEAIQRIQADVSASDYGKLLDETFAWLRQHSVYTVEIKSSRIPDKDYPDLEQVQFNSWIAQTHIVRRLQKRDFFVYPKYTRTAGRSIHSFDDYVDYVLARHPEIPEQAGTTTPRDFILQQERACKCDLYTRIFIDRTHTQHLIAYILGYTLCDSFFLQPRIINMPRSGKSEDALYYVYPIAQSSRIDDLFTDPRLW